VLTFVRFLLLLALLLLCLYGLGVPLTGVVSAISAATLAIGLAVKDILSSVANGIVLVINCPFKEGDYVEIGGAAGSIKEVKLMHTVLTTPDNKQVMIPNSQVFSAAITNFSANDARRMDIAVDVDYSENPEKVRKILLDVANKHPLVFDEPEPACHFNYSNASSITFNVRVWCKNKDYWTVNWDLNEQLTGTLIKKGVQIPFPQVTVSYRKEEKK
jgi:small conductance mechanosensitive channel